MCIRVLCSIKHPPIFQDASLRNTNTTLWGDYPALDKTRGKPSLPVYLGSNTPWAVGPANICLSLSTYIVVHFIDVRSTAADPVVHSLMGIKMPHSSPPLPIVPLGRGLPLPLASAG